VYRLDEDGKVIDEKKIKREVVFINVDKIEMIEYV
jgi:tRNA pseudouridine-54 N-methylase